MWRAGLPGERVTVGGVDVERTPDEIDASLYRPRVLLHRLTEKADVGEIQDRLGAGAPRVGVEAYPLRLEAPAREDFLVCLGVP